MANIHYLEDASKVLKELQSNGLIDKEQTRKLAERISELLANTEIKPFFDKKWQVLTEREILSPTGDAYVPDRVLIKEGEVQVIDYKTGSKTKELQHREQINQYAELLHQMGHKNIKKYIIYTEEEQKVIQL
jgi:ATP-dependent exoDNAse (exonuclease V) beta subunit